MFLYMTLELEDLYACDTLPRVPAKLISCVDVHAWVIIPYILESNPHPNLICTSFCRFLKKKKLVRGSNLHLFFNRPLPTRQTDSVVSDDGKSDE